jgi:TRAP transporter 4TM/12TM fusion protein
MADATPEDAEGIRPQELSPRWHGAVTLIGVAMGAFHLYTAATFVLAPMVQRSIHLAFALALLFICYPASNRKRLGRPTALSLAIGLLAVASCLYILAGWEEMTERTTDPFTLDLVFGVIAVAVVLEASRRTLGFELVLISIAFIAYGIWGEWLPDPLGHPGMDLERLTAVMYLSDQGVFGVPLGVSATYVFLFIIFAELLVLLGGASFFIEIAHALLGNFRGGPAKVAVVSSALMGTVSGSAVANVVTVGSVTIPMMKGTGYSSRYAAAVEAVASTGGQIMPPIMSTAAFVMAEMIGVPYASIAIAATLPAVLYFVSVFIAVDLQAAKEGLKGLPRAQLPSAWGAFRRNGHVLLPLGVLVYLLVIEQYSPMPSVFWSIVCMIATDAARSLLLTRRIEWRNYVLALRRAAVTSLPVIAACAAGGIIIGVVAGTGLGLTFSSSMIELSGGNMGVLLVFTMLASLILGTGLSTVASYIILAVLAAPALVQGGFHPIAAHLFVLYFGALSVITPPVALASYVAAGIAGADPTKVGWLATRLGAIAFLIPFYFINNTALLLMGSLGAIVWASFSALVGTWALVVGLEGYSFTRCGKLTRFGFIGAALLLIDPGVWTSAAGATLIAACLLGQWAASRSSAASA